MSGDAYAKAIEDIINKGIISTILSVAHELGIFSYLADAGTPKTSQEIADAKKLKQRYVQEAMNSLACANIVNVSKNSSGHVTYSMTSEQGAVMSGGQTMLLGILSAMSTRYERIIDCFRKDGPEGLPYSDDTWTQSGLDWMMYRRVDLQMELALDNVEGIRGKLESGINVIEFGSGFGGFIAPFAEKYPKSSFIASEYTVDATRKLKERHSHMTNMKVRQLNMMDPPDELADSFELALVNDVIHDLPNPLDGLKGYHKVLKPGGHLAFFDIDGHSDVTVNKEQNPAAPVLYATSTFLCVPGACQGPGSMALGACWGRDTAEKMIKEAGLKLISVHPHLNNVFVMYICQK